MHPYRPVSKRSPFGLQKGSFWTAKGVLLQCKRSPFTTQKEPFWNAKGLLFAMACSAADVSFKNI